MIYHHSSKICFNALIFALLLAPLSLVQAHSRALESFGDKAQFINPMIGLSIAALEQGVGHYMQVNSFAFGLMGSSKILGNELKIPWGARPDGTGFTGMPSGHTTSAWSAASYVRLYGGKYSKLCLPLYLSAAITGYSRIHAKRHSVAQVLTAIVLAEGLNTLSYYSNWQREHQRVFFNAGVNSLSVQFTFLF